MSMLPGSGKVTFCKLTDLERRGSASGDGGCDEGGQALLDHRMWVAVIPLMGGEARGFYAPFVRLEKILNGRTLFCATVE